jgi:hypothetical protein
MPLEFNVALEALTAHQQNRCGKFFRPSRKAIHHQTHATAHNPEATAKRTASKKVAGECRETCVSAASSSALPLDNTPLRKSTVITSRRT